MLEKVELYNFKSHRSTQLNLDNSRLHALVGQNSSGKTSILQALYYLSKLVDAEFKDIFIHERAPEFLTMVGQAEMSVTASGFWDYQNDQETWQACYGFSQSQGVNSWNPNGFLKIDEIQGDMRRWSSSLNNTLRNLNQGVNDDIQGSMREAVSTISKVLEKVKDTNWILGDTNNVEEQYLDPSRYQMPPTLKFAVYLKLLTTNLAKAAYSDAIAPQVEFDGSGLAPTLDYLRDEDPDKLQFLQEMLKRIVPSVKKIGVRRAKVTIDRQHLIQVDGKTISYEKGQELMGKEVVFDMSTGERIPAHAISEGTMLTLGLLTVLMNPKRPSLVLLDDVEQGLHPKAQRELVTVFKEIIEANEDLQIIFSTHSPYMIDELKPSQVHVLSNSLSGGTYTKRLDEHPDVEWAKQTLTTGEFWDAEGEDWVTAGVENG
jgi:predicted ATPase